MRIKLSDLFGRVYKSRMGMSQNAHTPDDAYAKFKLLYGGLTVGELVADHGRWIFNYTEEFKRHPKLRPLVGFPDTSKVYSSKDLWPFFGTRIPSLKQAVVQEIIKDEGIDETDQLQLLRRFGERTITNPFVLVQVDD